jgi:hypothetical protein
MHIVVGLREFLLAHGVFCQKRPRLSRRQALADCLLQDACVQLGPGEAESDSVEPSHEATGADEIHTERAPEQRLVEANVPPQMGRNSAGSPQKLNTHDGSKKEFEIGNVVVEEASTKRNSRRPHFSAYDNDPEDDDARHGNSGTLIKMYQSRKRFLGHYNEDLEARIREYDVLCQSCRVSGKEKRNMAVLMLQDDSLE